MRVVAVLAAVLLLASCSSTSTYNSNDPGGVEVTDSGSAVPVTYPPTTIGEAKALATTGDASAIHIVRSEKRPNGSCERPNVYATAEAG
jgi:hypothetical protein